MRAVIGQLSEMFTLLQFASSVLSAQSLMLSHRDSMGMHTPEEHMNWAGDIMLGLIGTFIPPPLQLNAQHSY